MANHNTFACKLIDEYGETHGYHFQHAENGGEFRVPGTRYFVDGYDVNKNVVIEVYEPRHKKNTERDLERQREIVKRLGCKFVILEIAARKPKKKDPKIPITTIQVKRYVVQQVKPRLEEKGWHLSWLTERLLNLWLSGSVDVYPEGGKL